MNKNTHKKITRNNIFATLIAFTYPLITQALDQQPSTKQKDSTSVEISYGELIDKITIFKANIIFNFP